MSAPVAPSSDLQTLWHAFAHATNQQAYGQAWLDLQCARLPGTRAGVLVLAAQQDDSAFETVASWPAATAVPAALSALVEDAIDEACGLVGTLDAGTGIAYPLSIDGRVAGVVALAVDLDRDEQLAAAMERLQWGIAWVELLVRRHQRATVDAELPRLRAAVEVVTAVLAAPDYATACLAFVTELATAFDCERVGLGEYEHGRIRLARVSHAAEFGKSMNLVRLLEAAMEEALFQGIEIAWPAAAEHAWVTRDHAALAGDRGSAAIHTLPLVTDAGRFGALTLECARPLDGEQLARVRAIAALSVEALAVRRRAERMLALRLVDAAREQLERLFGRGHLGRKLGLAGLLAFAALLAFVHIDYRVSADTVLEGAVRQVIVAPFDGYLASAPVRAGDIVGADDELCRLDDRDLRLERLNWASESTMLERRYEEALARHDRGEARVLEAQRAQTHAQLELVESRLARTVLRAPLAGLVVSGDLSQRLGATVEQGEVLYELAPLDDYRVILWVDEHEVADIEAGQRGELVLKALPEAALPVTVTRVTPLTEARDGGNHFRVEARLDAPAARLRPGMEGLAKLGVGPRSLWFTLSRPLVRWFVLQRWRWWP
ncbi:MAG: HlyD family efflux transporter periplasmic adaptor subunit [Gammaproteobacteria bacterium]